jgi:hypothetical protein
MPVRIPKKPDYVHRVIGCFLIASLSSFLGLGLFFAFQTPKVIAEYFVGYLVFAGFFNIIQKLREVIKLTRDGWNL